MTITEFLEARIAEDEARIARLAETDRRPVLSLSATVNHPQRLLAECAAKRAIIKQAGEASADRSQVIGEFCVGQAERDAEYATDPGKLILEALAAVYADHPDYDQEWALYGTGVK